MASGLETDGWARRMSLPREYVCWSRDECAHRDINSPSTLFVPGGSPVEVLCDAMIDYSQLYCMFFSSSPIYYLGRISGLVFCQNNDGTATLVSVAFHEELGG